MIIDGKECGWIEKQALSTGAISNDVYGEAAVETGAIKTGMLNSSVLIRTMDVFLNILAAGAAVVRSNEDLSAASPITFTIDAQPDVPRTITFHFDSHAQITAYSLTITGVNARGETVIETRTEADGFGDWETSNAFASITSIEFTRTTGSGAGDTMDVGIGSKLGLSNKLLAASGVYKVTKNKADYPAASYTAEAAYHTVDVSTGGAIVADDNFVVQYKTPLSLAS